jgi:hypothetical protein
VPQVQVAGQGTGGLQVGGPAVAVEIAVPGAQERAADAPALPARADADDGQPLGDQPAGRGQVVERVGDDVAEAIGVRRAGGDGRDRGDNPAAAGGGHWPAPAGGTAAAWGTVTARAPSPIAA